MEFKGWDGLRKRTRAAQLPARVNWLSRISQETPGIRTSALKRNIALQIIVKEGASGVGFIGSSSSSSHFIIIYHRRLLEPAMAPTMSAGPGLLMAAPSKAPPTRTFPTLGP